MTLFQIQRRTAGGRVFAPWRGRFVAGLAGARPGRRLGDG